jgi:hypothetical protein
MCRLIQTSLSAIVAVVALCWVEIGYAQVVAGLPWPIAVSPLNPSSTDVVHITVNTQWFCASSTPPATTVTGRSIQILVTLPDCFIPGVPPPLYVFTVDVGPLSPGAYEVTTSVQGFWARLPFPQPQPTGSFPFLVATPGPVDIPTLNSALLGVLAVLLAFVASVLIALRPNPAFEGTRRQMPSTWRASSRRAPQLTR